MKKSGITIVVILCVQSVALQSVANAADKQNVVDTITQAAHAYWAQRVVINHATDGTLYGYSSEQTIVDPQNPNDRYYKSDGPFIPEPHIFQEVENSPGHPSVAFAFVRAYEATGDKFLMRAAKELGNTLLSAQSDVGAGGWWQDMGTVAYDRRTGSPTYGQVVDLGQFVNLSPWGGHGNVLLDDQNVSTFDGCSYLSGYFLLRLYQALPVTDPDRDRYFQGAKWLADEIVGLKDVVDAQGGFKPYGNGGVPQIWPYNTMKNRPGNEAWPGYPYSIAHNVMVTLNDDAMPGALFFLMEFWKESQTNAALNESTYLDAIRLNIDYLLNVFDLNANPNGRSSWADFYWINDGSARANKPTWGRAYEPPALSSYSLGDEPLLGWWQYETDAARKARIEDTLLRNFLYFKYDAPPVNSQQVWRDLIRPYIRNGPGLVDGYDPANMDTWFWWRWYNSDTSAAPREVFVGAETPRATSHYDVHYGLDALDPLNNPDPHYPMMLPYIRLKMSLMLTAQDTLNISYPLNSNVTDRYNLDPDVRMFRGRPNAASMVGTALSWFDSTDGFFKVGGQLPSVTINNKQYYYVQDYIFETSMRYLAAGFEAGTGTLVDSDGDGYTDAEENQAGTDTHDSEFNPGNPGGPALTVSSTIGGSVATPGEGLFRYNNPTVVSVAAVAAQDYFFVDWTGSAVAARKIADANVASTTVTVDAGYTLVANFDTNKHTLTISSTGSGSVTNPGEGTYLYDNVNVVPVNITATPSANNNFANWTGTAVIAGKVADPTSTNTTVTPDADYTLVANFSIVQHSLVTSSNVGGSVSTPGEGIYAYDHGATVSVSASPGTHYHFVNWTGTAVSAGKVANADSASTTVTMDAAYTIQANFAIDQHTLTTSSTSGGSVSSPGEGSFLYDSGTGVAIQATPSSGSYFFVNWTGTAASAGKVANPNAASTTVTVDSPYTLQANFGQQDGVAPTIANLSPVSGSIQAPLDSLVILHVTDAGIGVRASSVEIELDGTVIYTGDVSSYNSAGGTCRRTGTPADYTYAYQSNALFDFDDLKSVTVNAADIGGVAMAQQSYSFRTEMRSFGQNKQVNSGLGLDNLDNGSTVTVRDINGNIWAVWHAGPVGSRDIYLGKLTAGATTFDTSIQLTTSSADQMNPAIATSNGRLYVVWQDNSRGDWDIWGTTSANWSNQQRIADSDPNQHFNQVNPAVAVDDQAPMHAYVVFQDDRAGNHDIYIAESSNTFITNTITPVTSHASDQTSPAIAVNSSNTVYVLWTDARNSANGTDIYGASGSPWTNVPVVSKAANQSSPQIAVESAGSVLHMLWVDQISGSGDIYYDSSNGLPGGPLAGSNLVDDTVGAVQLLPTLAVTGTGAGLKVFASWQDSRNISGGTGDLDLYMVQTNSGSGTNVFVGDGGTNSDQTEPAMGVDQHGYPYVVWTDDRGTNDGIYYAGSTRMQSTPLLSGVIDASSGGTIGNSDVQSINDVDDISIAVPGGASPYDVTVSVTRIENPHDSTLPFLNGCEFGPSGLNFSSPVTITIPFAVSSTAGTPTAYWYNSVTGALSQQGISNIEIIQVTPSLHALRFTTTHLTPYYALMGAASSSVASESGGGGGGGCSLSDSRQGGSILEYFLPYMLLALFMLRLRLRDRGHRANAQ